MCTLYFLEDYFRECLWEWAHMQSIFLLLICLASPASPESPNSSYCPEHLSPWATWASACTWAIEVWHVGSTSQVLNPNVAQQISLSKRNPGVAVKII